MRFVQQSVGVGFVAVFAMQGIGCQTQQTADRQAPETDDTVLTEQYLSPDGSWNATSNNVQFLYNTGVSGGLTYSYYQGTASITGPAGSAQTVGVCTLMMGTRLSEGQVACDPSHVRTTGTLAGSNTDCGTEPAGGYNYCFDIYGTGSYYCFVRPGDRLTWCAGTPALQQQYPTDPTKWKVTMPASGSATLATPEFTPPTGGANYITDTCFDKTHCTQSMDWVWGYGPSSTGGSSGGLNNN